MDSNESGGVLSMDPIEINSCGRCKVRWPYVYIFWSLRAITLASKHWTTLFTFKTKFCSGFTRYSDTTMMLHCHSVFNKFAAHTQAVFLIFLSLTVHVSSSPSYPYFDQTLLGSSFGTPFNFTYDYVCQHIFQSHVNQH